MEDDKTPEFLRKGRKILLNRPPESCDSDWMRNMNGLWEVDKPYISDHPPHEGQLCVVLKSIGRKHQAYINIPYDPAIIKPLEEMAHSDMFSSRDVPVMKPISFRPKF